AEGEVAAVEHFARLLQVLKPLSRADLLPDGIDNPVHHLDRQAEDDEFRVSEGVIQADGVGEDWPFLVLFDHEDVPAVPLDSGKQLPFVVVRRLRLLTASVWLLPGHRLPWHQKISSVSA